MGIRDKIDEIQRPVFKQASAEHCLQPKLHFDKLRLMYETDPTDKYLW